MEELKTKKFTETAVLFTLTGHIFIRGDASSEYYLECINEIREDAVFKYIMSSVTDNIRDTYIERVEEFYPDVDPIASECLCERDPRLKAIRDYSNSHEVRETLKLVESKFLTNGYLDVSPITFYEYCSLSDSISDELSHLEEKKK